MSGLAITSGTLAPKASTDRTKLAEAAKRFEAIFVRQMLASARKAGFGDELFGGQAADTFKSMQDEKFADVVSQCGALGLAATIERQLGAVAGQADAAKS